MTDGVLVIDKPTGMTSHDVVDEVRRRFKTRKVGHGGTLDPDATGVLVVGLGRATRFISYIQALPKRYEADALFGISTTTQDASGEVIEQRPVTVDRAVIEEAMATFKGDLLQVPPMVSAVKVGGEALYKKARRGEDVPRNARKVTIYEFSLLDHVPGDTTASARFDVTCSGGTYIRTLVHDLGEQLGCGAHLTGLRRTEAGGFGLRDAVALESVDENALRPLTDAVRQLPSIDVSAAGAKLVSHGRPLDVGALDPEFVPDGSLTAIVSDGELVAVYRKKGGKLLPDRVVGR